MGVMMTRKELADVAGYSYHQLYNIDRALPEDKRLFVEGDGKKIDLAVFVRRWVAYNVEKATGMSGDSLEDEKARHEKLKADKTEIELKRLREEFVDIDEVAKLWSDITGVVVNRLVNLPKKLAPMLVMLERAEDAEEIIERDLRDALNLISGTPLPVTGDRYSLAEAEDEGDDD